MATGLSIRRLIEQVTSGAIRIPAFQRGFVWDAERVAFLMDSIYKGYPFGAVILWRTKEKLNAERALGPFQLPDGDPDYPIDYVLDGQQRITSIFGVFQSELEPTGDDSWTQIYFDMDADADLQESQFLALSADDVEPGRHFPIKTFFDVAGYRQATERLGEGQALQIDAVQSIFKEAAIPTQEIATDDRGKVAIVFERVNRMGVDLDVFQLLTAWTWSEDFDLQERFTELAAELEPHGFGAVGEDSNLLLRCCSAVVGGDASPTAFINLKGSEVRDRFDDISNGIRGAIDFLRKNFKIESLGSLPYAAALVPLCVFFARSTAAVTDAQRELLERWFWRACFARRYSAGVIRNLNRDIEEAAALRDGTRDSNLAGFAASVDADFFDQTFNVGSVNTRTFVLMLAQQNPLSFASGNPVTLSMVLQSYNRNEFHHLMPRAFLRESLTNREINSLVNFAIISAADNKKLGGDAPSKYKAKMPAAKTALILDRALCPASLFTDDWPTFAEERTTKLVAVAQSLI